LKLDVEIETSDNIEFDLFETKDFSKGQPTVTIGKDVSAIYKGTEAQLSTEAPFIVHLILNILYDVGIALASAWLYDKLRQKKLR
jgi:hypothetical protein